MIGQGFMDGAATSSFSTNGLNLDAQRIDGARWCHLNGGRKETSVSLVKGNLMDIFSHPPPFTFTMCSFVKVNLKILFYSLAKSLRSHYIIIGKGHQVGTGEIGTSNVIWQPKALMM